MSKSLSKSPTSFSKANRAENSQMSWPNQKSVVFVALVAPTIQEPKSVHTKLIAAARVQSE